MDKLTIVVQDAPYGSEKAYNALRYASALLADQVAVNVFLLADGVGVAKRNQKTPTGYYNTADLLAQLIAKGVRARLERPVARPGVLAGTNSSRAWRSGTCPIWLVGQRRVIPSRRSSVLERLFKSFRRDSGNERL